MKFILTLILFLHFYLSYSQKNTKGPVNQNRISIIIGHTQFKDENLHEKVFSGLTIGSFYQHSRINKRISEFGSGLKISLMRSAYEDFPSSANILLLGHYRYLFPIVRYERLEYYLGPIADMQYGSSFYFNWDESHLYFANYVSGGISNRIIYKAGNKSFNFNLDIPVISCIFRPEYNRQYKIDNITFGGILTTLSNNPEAVLPNKNFYVKTGLEMIFLIRARKTRSIGYDFRYHYMRAVNGNPYQNIEYLISYKFSF